MNTFREYADVLS